MKLMDVPFRSDAAINSQWAGASRWEGWRTPNGLLLKLNSETPQQRLAVVTFGAICDRYLKEEMP